VTSKKNDTHTHTHTHTHTSFFLMLHIQHFCIKKIKNSDRVLLCISNIEKRDLRARKPYIYSLYRFRSTPELILDFLIFRKKGSNQWEFRPNLKTWVFSKPFSGKMNVCLRKKIFLCEIFSKRCAMLLATRI